MTWGFDEGLGAYREHTVLYNGEFYVVKIYSFQVVVYAANNPSHVADIQEEDLVEMFGEDWDNLEPREFVKFLDNVGILPEPEKPTEDPYETSTLYLSLKKRLEDRIDSLIFLYGKDAWNEPPRFNYDRAYYIQEPYPGIIKILDSNKDTLFRGYIYELNLQEAEAILNAINNLLGLKAEEDIEPDDYIKQKMSSQLLYIKRRLENRMDELMEQFGEEAWNIPSRIAYDNAYWLQIPTPNLIQILDTDSNVIFESDIYDLNLQEMRIILTIINNLLGLKAEEKHEDFKQIYNNMLKQYGASGDDIYYSWKAKYKLDDTKPYVGKNVAKLEAGNTKSFTVAHNGTYYEVIINSSHPYISVSPEESASDPWFAQGDTVAKVFGENWKSLDPKQIVEFLDSAGALPKSIKQESWVNPKEVDKPGNVSGIIEPPPPGGNLPVGPPIETSQPRFPPGMGAEPKEYPPSSNLEFSEADNPEELAEELLLSGYSVNDIAEELIENYDLTSSVARNIVNKVRSKLISPEIRENIQNFIKKEKEVSKDYFEILKEIEDKYKLPQNLAIDEIHTVHLEEKIQ